jgi:maleate isomerase
MPPRSALDLVAGAASGGATRPVHIGVLVPWANTMVETEMPNLRLRDVVFHYARLVPSSGSTALDRRFLDGLRAAIPAAVTSLSKLPLASVLLACTSAGFTATGDGPADVVTAFDALVMALDRLGSGRIALATPYPQAITETEAATFVQRGVTVTSHVSLDRDDGYSDVTGEEIHTLLSTLPRTSLADADALVLSCTAWPTVNLIADLEADLGLPVLSSNLAMAAHAASITTRGIPQ